MDKVLSLQRLPRQLMDKVLLVQMLLCQLMDKVTSLQRLPGPLIDKVPSLEDYQVTRSSNGHCLLPPRPPQLVLKQVKNLYRGLLNYSINYLNQGHLTSPFHYYCKVKLIKGLIGTLKWRENTFKKSSNFGINLIKSWFKEFFK